MKRLALLFLLASPAFAQQPAELAMVGVGGPGTGANGYAHQYRVVISHTMFPGALSNYTVTLCANMTLGNSATCPTGALFKGSGSGGAVLNTVTFNGQTVCADCVVTSDSGCATPMSFDVASWVSSTGAWETYVMIASPSTSVDTTVYVCLGKSSVTTYQGGSVGAAYDGNTCAVYHLSPGLSLKDSSSHGADLTNHSLSATTSGQIDGGASNGGTGYAVGTTGCTLAGNPLTLSAWVLLTANAGSPGIVMAVGTAAVGKTLEMGPRNSSITGNSQCELVGFGSAIATLPTNAWVYIACAMPSGSSGNVELYKNGSSVGTGTSATAFTGSNAVSVLGDVGGGVLVTGTIDEARVATLDRGSTWLTADYNNQSAPSTYLTYTLVF